MKLWWWQCARRWFDEGETSHLINLGKYVSAMVAAGAKVAYEKENKSVGWLCLLIVLSTIATAYQLYWDFVKDWGLLQFNSKNPWLRDELILRHKCIYYLSLVHKCNILSTLVFITIMIRANIKTIYYPMQGLNLVLRLAWLQTVFHYNFEKVDYRALNNHT